MSCRSCGAPDRPEIPYCLSCGELRRAARCDAHPHAVARKCCVVCATPVCELCREGSRYASLCSRHSTTSVFSGWSEVFRAAGELEAGLVAGILRGAGVEAHVLSQKDSANVVTFGGLSVIRVLVPAFRHEEAASLLRAEGYRAHG